VTRNIAVERDQASVIRDGHPEQVKIGEMLVADFVEIEAFRL
jgi:magnesium-transporting ATPase (P-type)